MAGISASIPALCRAVDEPGRTVNFPLSERRDVGAAVHAAKRIFENDRSARSYPPEPLRQSLMKYVSPL